MSGEPSRPRGDEERISRNEAAFRQVNEQIEEVNRAFAMLTQTMEVVCECGNVACTDRFLMTIPAYERLRSDPGTFVIRPGHELPDVEAVIEERAGYSVVKKRAGTPEHVARETYPRGG